MAIGHPWASSAALKVPTAIGRTRVPVPQSSSRLARVCTGRPLDGHGDRYGLRRNRTLVAAVAAAHERQMHVHVLGGDARHARSGVQHVHRRLRAQQQSTRLSVTSTVAAPGSKRALEQYGSQ